MTRKKILINILSYVIVIVLLYLLFTEFRKNWASLQSHELKFDPYFLFLTFASMLATYLLTTYGWQLALNTLAQGNRILFRDSVAIVNTSNLTKYLPGKVWSYALQAYWLSRKGFSNSLIVFVYIINMSTLILTFLIVGFCYLAVSPGELPFRAIISCLIGLVALDLLLIRYYSVFFNAFLSVVRKFLKQEIPRYEAPTRLLLDLHLVHVVSAFSFGMSGYLMCRGIGFDLAKDSIYLVMSSMILSDMIGFLSIIVPSGLGVREGVMYILLKGDVFGVLALILPVASRIVIIVVDVFLGAIGFVMLKYYLTEKEAARNGKPAL